MTSSCGGSSRGTASKRPGPSRWIPRPAAGHGLVAPVDEAVLRRPQQGEVAVGEPAEELRHRVPTAVGGRGHGRLLLGVTKAGEHRGEVVGGHPDVVERVVDRGVQRVRLDVEALAEGWGHLDEDPRLGEAIPRQGAPGEVVELEKVVVGIPLHAELRVGHLVDVPSAAGDRHRQRVDEERAVVGDDEHDRAPVVVPTVAFDVRGEHVGRRRAAAGGSARARGGRGSTRP